MLHELIVALKGYPGDIFVCHENSTCVKFKQDLPFICQSEGMVFERLGRLASGYMKLNKFVRRNGVIPDDTSDEQGDNICIKKGLYIWAFCQGLDNVLQPYRVSVGKIEQQLIADKNLTVGYVQCSLEKYQLLFPALCQILDDIEVRGYHGCAILDILYKSTLCGITDVKESVEHILKVCHSVFYRQLAEWLFKGRLEDDFGEFFIYRAQNNAQADVDDRAAIGMIESVDKDLLLEDQDSTKIANREFKRQFEILPAMLPSYIPHATARKILFIGESVHMFEQRQNGKKEFVVPLLNNKTKEYHRDLVELSRQLKFVLVNFEELIDKIRNYVAEELWSLVVVKSDLLESLKIMKEFFLLGRGELFLEFIELQSNIKALPEGDSEREINLVFQHAARNVLFDNEDLLKRFTFTFSTSKPDEADKNEPSIAKKLVLKKTIMPGDIWSRLMMNYRAEWPLHIFFTPSVIAQYNSLFGFLIHVKRVQQELHQCWNLQMQRRNQISSDPQTASKWWLRNHMTFLINNLQYYLQVDVIESQFSVLLNSLDSTRDFEVVRHAHDCFLSALHSHCFIQSRQISRCLYEILDLALRFCGLLRYSDAVLSKQQVEQINEISRSFQRQSSLLFAMLSGVQNHQANPHLAQLLLRIDFNRYFSTMTQQFTSAKVGVV